MQADHTTSNLLYYKLPQNLYKNISSSTLRQEIQQIKQPNNNNNNRQQQKQKTEQKQQEIKIQQMLESKFQEFCMVFNYLECVQHIIDGSIGKIIKQFSKECSQPEVQEAVKFILNSWNNVKNVLNTYKQSIKIQQNALTNNHYKYTPQQQNNLTNFVKSLLHTNKNITKQFYTVLHYFNRYYRLPKGPQQLLQYEKQHCQRYKVSLLGQAGPCQYINLDNYQFMNGEVKQKWIGHGWYYKSGNNETKDNYNNDYNSLEDKFYRIKSARVLMVDYQLLRTDFKKQLQNKSQQQINQWLLQQTAYFSSGQIQRISKGGDLHEQLHFNTQNQIQEKLIDFSRCKYGVRYRGGARAVNFYIDDEYAIDCENGQFLAMQINVKGVGSEKIMTGFGVKQNGMLSVVDSIKQYAFQKLLNKIGKKQKQKWTTVQTYAFIDVGLRYKQGFQCPATGFKDDRIGLTIRQASSRFQNSQNQMCYYSVVPEQKQNNQIVKGFRQSLLKWGVTSQQIPIQALKQGQISIEDLSGSWNIQADATMTRFLDFSQFYVLPTSKLPQCWKMSINSLNQGILANRFAYKILLQNQSLIKKYFNLAKKQLQDTYKQKLQTIKQKYGPMAGVTVKPSYSWSWFLQTDDSQIQKNTIKYGINKENIEINHKLFSLLYQQWMNF